MRRLRSVCVITSYSIHYTKLYEFYIPPGGLVYKETAERLKQHGVTDGLLAELKNILDRCEAYHYGAIGGNESAGADIREMLHAALTVFEKIDQCLKK